ncbi:hypothetical protein BDV06DRAFT_229460 [Aspergillus oleicola]
MASVAAAVNDIKSYNKWTKLATSLTKAINVALWNDEAGVYSIERSDPGNFTAALGFAITAGVANNTQAQLSLSHLPSLKLGPGYRNSTTYKPSDSSINLSPNTNGFLLPGLMRRKQAGPVRFLLDNLWGAMIVNETTNPRASWDRCRLRLIFTSTPIHQRQNRMIALHESKATNAENAGALTEKFGSPARTTHESAEAINPAVEDALAAQNSFALASYCRKIWGNGQQVEMVGTDVWDEGYGKATLHRLIMEGELRAYREMPQAVVDFFAPQFERCT